MTAPRGSATRVTWLPCDDCGTPTRITYTRRPRSRRQGTRFADAPTNSGRRLAATCPYCQASRDAIHG